MDVSDWARVSILPQLRRTCVSRVKVDDSCVPKESRAIITNVLSCITWKHRTLTLLRIRMNMFHSDFVRKLSLRHHCDIMKVEKPLKLLQGFVFGHVCSKDKLFAHQNPYFERCGTSSLAPSSDLLSLWSRTGTSSEARSSSRFQPPELIPQYYSFDIIVQMNPFTLRALNENGSCSPGEPALPARAWNRPGWVPRLSSGQGGTMAWTPRSWTI